MKLTVNEKFNLITRNLQEVICNEVIMKKIIAARPLNIYWGTAPTGSIHIGYLVPLLKISDLLLAGCKVTILLADLHAYLDNMKSTFNTLKFRTQYYEIMIKEILKILDIDITLLEFVKGRDFQLKSDYTMDMYRLMSITTLHDAKKSGAEVVKQSDNPYMSGLLYPSLQILDEEYLHIDAQFGGIDQRKIFIMAEKYLPKLGYKRRFHFMNEMVPGLSCVSKKSNNNVIKMSSSDINSKIDILDSKKIVNKKINQVYCLEGDVDDNTLLILLKKIILPVFEKKNWTFKINRSDKYGGNLEYKTYEYSQIRDDFKNKLLHPADFKNGISSALNLILNPIRNSFNTKENMKLFRKAYK